MLFVGDDFLPSQNKLGLRIRDFGTTARLSTAMLPVFQTR